MWWFQIRNIIQFTNCAYNLPENEQQFCFENSLISPKKEAGSCLFCQNRDANLQLLVNSFQPQRSQSRPTICDKASEMWSKLKFGAAGVGESQRFGAWKFELI